MIERSKYKKLRKAVAAQLEEQKSHAFVAITKGLMETITGLREREVKDAWPHIVREFGFVDDGTGYDTWTLPGRGLMQNLDRFLLKDKP